MVPGQLSVGPVDKPGLVYFGQPQVTLLSMSGGLGNILHLIPPPVFT